MTSAIPVQRSTNLADKPTGSVHNCEDRYHINLFIRSSHIRFSCNHSQFFITSRVYFEPA